MHSPTGYYAHYATHLKAADGTRRKGWTDVYPVIGYTDVALVIDSDGFVVTVRDLLKEVREDVASLDLEDGETARVHLTVAATPGEE